MLQSSSRWRPTLGKLIAAAAVLAAFGLPLFSQVSHAGTQEASLEQILAKHYEAMGVDRQKEIKSIRMDGRAVTMGMEAPFTRWHKRPDKVLLEIYVMDMTGMQAYDGETAWWYMPFMGHASAEVMTADMARMMEHDSDFDGPLVDYREKGHEIELLGTEPVGEVECYKLEVTLADGDVQTHYLDAATLYPKRVVTAEQDIDFDDWMVVGGLPTPGTIVVMGAMGEQIIYIDEVEFDVEIDDARFSMR